MRIRKNHKNVVIVEIDFKKKNENFVEEFYYSELLRETNTSGMGSTALVPSEVKGWNWGAFLIPPIWGIANKSYITLLSFIPILNLVWPFICGAHGNEWAWRNKKWESSEHFHKIQRRWVWRGIFWAIILTLLNVIIKIMYFNYIVSKYSH